MPADPRLQKYPVIKDMLDRLRRGGPSDIVIVFIPSHTRDKEPLPLQVQEKWAKDGMTLFGKLFHGATAFRNLDGIYWDQEMQDTGVLPDWDKPIMIQSLADRKDVLDMDKLELAARFFRDMGEKLDQRSIGVILNNKYLNIMIPPAASRT